MAGWCFCSYLPAPFHSKLYSNLIHMVEMDRSFLCVHWNITRDVKFECSSCTQSDCFSLSGKASAKKRYTIVKAFPNEFFIFQQQLQTGKCKSHESLTAMLVIKPLFLKPQKTSPSLALAEQRGKQNRYLVSARCVVCFQFSVLLERNKI